jgi:outer membrane protein OmpA-like peptidoglycan-associated protein/tetratricopeptide (TPR) repeat protein
MRNFFFIVFVLSVASVYAQPELGECDQEVEEIAKNQLPKALKHWRAKNYREAERYLAKAVDMDPNYADALYLLGDLYVKKMQIERAEILWLKLLEVCPDYKAEVKYFLGSILLENGKRKKAIELFESFLSDPLRDVMFDTEVKTALKEAKLKEELLGNPVEFNPVPVKRLSGVEDEYLATISPDQETMYFTRRVKKVNRRDGPAAQVRLVEEFTKAERTGASEFEVGAPMPSPFNESFNEGGPSVTADNTELYFTVCEDLNGYKNCDIYYTEKDEFGYWITPRSVGDHINRRDSWESQASVSANADALYFASNRVGGVGGLDLYKCERLPDGKWSAPRNLGKTINTSGNEKTPFIHSDSKTLYFSSDGLQGLGGFDIFLAKATGDTTWQAPQNIGYPINTEDDDLGLFVSLDGKTGYFASNKFRKASGWDIYQFSLPERAKPNKVTLITGKVDSDEGEGDNATAIEIKNLKTKEVTRINVDKETGSYARVVETRPQEDLILTVKKKDAAFTSKYIGGSDVNERGVAKASLKVEKLEVGKEYQLNDINFATNSYQLDEVSKSVIDEFIYYLKDNPGLKADIQGHTDNVGNDGDNMQLSKNRAKTVYDYVLQNGVPASRVSHHGYGETKPRATNDTEEGRAQNRRTVFVITSK